MSSDDKDKCPKCGAEDWIKFQELSLCAKPDGTGARFEMGVICRHCGAHGFVPGCDFPTKAKDQA